MSSVLYYSKYCENCKKLLYELGKTDMKNNVHFLTPLFYNKNKTFSDADFFYFNFYFPKNYFYDFKNNAFWCIYKTYILIRFILV